MISKVEIQILVDQFNLPVQLLFYFPFVYKLNFQSLKALPKFENRQHFVSIGNFKHKPNLDMVRYLYKDIWPKIRKRLSDAEWHIYGAYCPESIKQLHNKSKGIHVKGRAKNALDTLKKYRVMLAPLRFGAGLKGKCLDSMIAGTPSVTTSIGAEGVCSAQTWPGYVEDNIQDFIVRAIDLYTNKSAWEEKHNQGFKILKNNFNVSDFKKEFKYKIDESFKNLKTLRNKNIVGQLLKHHSHKSTKYMSLWIQAKNMRPKTN